MANYTDAPTVAAQVGVTEADAARWLDAADALLEQWTGEAYKGQTVTQTFDGNGQAVLRAKLAPYDTATTAPTVTVYDPATGVTTTDLVHGPGADFLLHPHGLVRLGAGLVWVPPDLTPWGSVAANVWPEGYQNVTLTYVRPGSAAAPAPPAGWRLVATLVAGQMALWAAQYGATGLAVRRELAVADARVVTVLPDATTGGGLAEQLTALLRAHLPRERQPWRALLGPARSGLALRG